MTKLTSSTISTAMLLTVAVTALSVWASLTVVPWYLTIMLLIAFALVVLRRSPAMRQQIGAWISSASQNTIFHSTILAIAVATVALVTWVLATRDSPNASPIVRAAEAKMQQIEAARDDVQESLTLLTGGINEFRSRSNVSLADIVREARELLAISEDMPSRLEELKQRQTDYHVHMLESDDVLREAVKVWRGYAAQASEGGIRETYESCANLWEAYANAIEQSKYKPLNLNELEASLVYIEEARLMLSRLVAHVERLPIFDAMEKQKQLEDSVKLFLERFGKMRESIDSLTEQVRDKQEHTKLAYKLNANAVSSAIATAREERIELQAKKERSGLSRFPDASGRRKAPEAHGNIKEATIADGSRKLGPDSRTLHEHRENAARDERSGRAEKPQVTHDTDGPTRISAEYARDDHDDVESTARLEEGLLAPARRPRLATAVPVNDHLDESDKYSTPLPKDESRIHTASHNEPERLQRVPAKSVRDRRSPTYDGTFDSDTSHDQRLNQWDEFESDDIVDRTRNRNERQPRSDRPIDQLSHETTVEQPLSTMGRRYNRQPSSERPYLSHSTRTDREYRPATQIFRSNDQPRHVRVASEWGHPQYPPGYGPTPRQGERRNPAEPSDIQWREYRTMPPIDANGRPVVTVRENHPHRGTIVVQPSSDPYDGWRQSTR